MDEVSLFPIPVDLLNYLNESGDMNPEGYKQQQYRSFEDQVERIAQRLYYLKVSATVTLFIVSFIHENQIIFLLLG
jgi:hypothetical protein